MEEKLKKLQNMYNQEPSIYKKIYILATINKLKAKITEKKSLAVIEKKKEEVNKYKEINESRIVVEIKDNQIVREWPSLSICSRELGIPYVTLVKYYNHVVKKPKYNIMRRKEYLEKKEKGIVIENLPIQKTKNYKTRKKIESSVNANE